jgi:protein Mpv17
MGATADTVAQGITIVRRRAEHDPDPTRTQKLALALDEKLDQKLPHYGDQLVPTHSATHALPPPFDYHRLALFTSWGFLMAPLFFKWLQFLDRRFPIMASSRYVPLLKRVALDQLGFAPVGIAGFFAYMAYLEPGGNVEAVKTRLEHLYLPTLYANYALWPAAQVINFWLMPLKFQLPFSSMVGMVWGAYVSLVNSSDDP